MLRISPFLEVSRYIAENVLPENFDDRPSILEKSRRLVYTVIESARDGREERGGESPLDA